jgi:hypothetical protein
VNFFEKRGKEVSMEQDNTLVDFLVKRMERYGNGTVKSNNGNSAKKMLCGDPAAWRIQSTGPYKGR